MAGLLSLLQPQTQTGATTTSAPSGLLDLLMPNSGVAQFADSNRGLLGALGAGIASGPDFASGLANAAKLMPAARAADQQYNLQQQNKNKTVQYLQAKYPELANAVNAGLDPGTAYGLALKQDFADKERQRQLSLAQTFAKGIADKYPDVASALNTGAITPADAFKYMQTGQKPPTVTDIYDKASGEPYKAQWNPTTRSWDMLGGVKIPEGVASAQDDAATAHEVAQGIINGIQPPTMTGMYKLSGRVRAELASQGYDLTKAQQDWAATSRYLSTANGPQQTRLRQSVQQVSDQLDNISTLADQWNAGNFVPLNKMAGDAAKNGLLSQQAASIKTKLDAAIADMTAELGGVYMGGNSPTDHAMELAAKNLSGDWSAQTLKDNIAQIRRNLQIRMNSLNVGPAGTPNNQYAPAGATPAASPSLDDYKSRYGLD